MIYEHEIPSQSRLYFGKSAKLKRDIEAVASDILYQENYEEIVTPVFSYHQHDTINEKELIRFSDRQNHIISLRADSTLDIVRIITKRLRKSSDQKKWFYIQPVYKFPTLEVNQIGAEEIENSDLSLSINDSVKILNALELKPLLQISNINIPRLITKELNLSLDLFKNANLEEILNLNIPWLSQLAYLQKVSQIDTLIDEVPEMLKVELLKIKLLCAAINYPDIVIAPLYYAKMQYYDNLFFRYIQNNETLGMGGNYNHTDLNATGFALYTDKLIEEMSE
ncbi:MAG TPA: ATP phosphoribosyltransferase regulatory subunit [Campylobacterales bacterium]|nr:ATP phosphoribosyltransferase regulatory subunit [Campylobacterales bacterium]